MKNVAFWTILLFAFTIVEARAQVDTTPWHLEEVWTIGDADEGVFFRWVDQLEIGPNEELYLRDGQESSIRVLSSDGQEIDTFGRSGKAPGEFSEVSSILLSRNRLFASDRTNQRITEFDLKGRLLSTYSVPAQSSWVAPDLLYWDDANQLLVMRYLVAEDNPNLLHAHQLETESLKDEANNVFKLISKDDPVASKRLNFSGSFVSESWTLESELQTFFIVPKFYNGSISVSEYDDGAFVKTAIFEVNRGFQVKGASLVEITRKEFQEAIRAASPNYGMTSGPDGSIYYEIHEVVVGIAPDVVNGSIHVFFRQLKNGKLKLYVDEFDLERGHIGRHEISGLNANPSKYPKIVATTVDGSIYFAYNTEEMVPVLSKMRLVTTQK